MHAFAVEQAFGTDAVKAAAAEIDDDLRRYASRPRKLRKALLLLREPIEARFRRTDELDEAARLEVGNVTPGCGP